ncbi:MAG TPA: hypothetical protein VFV58_30300 [Blastocatellia bacterium]|jgi:hypothetical protein|nr:hypothetical protein [Blastocatellia bacterium]
MKKLAFFSIFILLMLCAAHKNAQAQGVVTGITICEYDIPNNVVNGYSDTIADPVASLYYGVYTEGYLYRNLSLLQSGAAGPAEVEATVFTQDPNAVQDTQYDLVTSHYVVDIYYIPIDPFNFYGDDVLGYSLLPFAEVPTPYPFEASGPEVFSYDVLYYLLGNTRVTVGYFPPRLDTINPSWGYERSEVDVTLTGHNVDAGNFNTPVQVNVSGGITATVQSIDSTTLHARFQIPDNLTGQQQVTITSTHGTSNPLNFIAVDRQPQITGISPSSLDAGTTTSVTIDGTDFGANPDLEISGVTGVQRNITSRSDTRIVLDIGVPVDAPEGDILITVISRGANGTGFLPGPPNTSPRSNTEDVGVRPVQPEAEIGEFIAVGKGQTIDVKVTVTPDSNTTPITLKLMATEGTGEARFDSNDSTTLTITKTTTVKIKGVTESSKEGNMRLEASAGTTFLDLHDFTVIEVTLSIRTSDKLSDDNTLTQVIINDYGANALGALFSTGAAEKKWRTMVEIVGAIKPKDFGTKLGSEIDVVLAREKIKDVFFRDTVKISEEGPIEDTSIERYLDSTPSNNGNVFDIDGPGYLVDGDPGTVIRRRVNFRQWATVNGVRVSGDFKWFSCLSLKKTAGNDERDNTVTGDNKAGAGEIKLTWNLQ